MNLIDDAHFLRSIEKSGKSALDLRRPRSRKSNGAKRRILDELGLEQDRGVLAVTDPLSIGLTAFNRTAIGDLRENETGRFVGRARPVDALFAVSRVAAHSSPMSHACSRSFFEYALKAVSVCVLRSPGTVVMCSVTTDATPS